MKKFLSAAVALGMVAGLAATASALELKVKGTYKADGYYISQGNGAAGGGGVFPFNDDTSNALRDGDAKSDSWYQHTFRIDPTLVINDKIQVKSDLRIVDSNTVWGSQDDLDLNDGGNFKVKKLWMTYDSPIGKLEVGRRPAGAWMGGFVNSGSSADRIMWHAPKMDNFKAYAFLQKKEERDGYDGTLSNDDNDYYEVAAGYVAEGTTLWLGVGANRDSSAIDDNMIRVKGYGDIALNSTFTLATEFDVKRGDKGDVDYDSHAFIISAIGNFGDLSASLHYATISGDNDTDATKNGVYDVNMGTGKDFEPLYILTGSAANILNGDRGANLVGTAVRTAGAHAIVGLADFKASEDLTLHGGIGWGKADDAPAGVDDEYGIEVDLGMAYNLYQNLTYELHFGFWSVGDFAKLGGMTESEDIYLLSHHLTMKF